MHDVIVASYGRGSHKFTMEVPEGEKNKLTFHAKCFKTAGG